MESEVETTTHVLQTALNPSYIYYSLDDPGSHVQQNDKCTVLKI